MRRSPNSDSLVWVLALAAWLTVMSPLRGALEDVGGVVFAVAIATVTGFLLLWIGQRTGTA